MVTDPIADFLIRIKNAYQAEHQEVRAPYSRLKEKIAKILVKNGYLQNLKVEGERNKPQTKEIVCQLTYPQGRPALTKVERISKPGRRIYAGWEKIPLALSGYGLTLVSTSQGVMTGKEAKKKKLGGEIIAKIW